MCPIHLLHRTTSKPLHGLDLSGTWFGGQGGEVVLALWQLCSQKRVFQNPSVDQCLGPESGPALRHWRLPPLEPWTMQSPRAGLKEEAVWGWPPRGRSSILTEVCAVSGF